MLDRKVFVYPEDRIERGPRVSPALRASLLGIAAMICPDCEMKGKKEKGNVKKLEIGKRRSDGERTGTNLPKHARLKGVRLIFLTAKLEDALAAAQLLARELGREIFTESI